MLCAGFQSRLVVLDDSSRHLRVNLPKSSHDVNGLLKFEYSREDLMGHLASFEALVRKYSGACVLDSM